MTDRAADAPPGDESATDDVVRVRPPETRSPPEIWEWLAPPSESERRAHREWSLARLGIADDELPADPAAVDRRLLAALADTDGVVTPDRLEALDVLRGRPGPAHCGREEREAALHEELDVFVGEFFSLPPGERRRRWNTLWSASETFPPLRWRLEALKVGLDAPCERIDDPDPTVVKLASLLRESFTLRGRERARQRRRILALAAMSHARWRSAAFHLRRVHPHVAALDAPVLDRLTSESPPSLRRRAARRSTPKLFGIGRRGVFGLAVASVAIGFALSWWVEIRRTPTYSPHVPTSVLSLDSPTEWPHAKYFAWRSIDRRISEVERREPDAGRKLREDWEAIQRNCSKLSDAMLRVGALESAIRKHESMVLRSAAKRAGVDPPFGGMEHGESFERRRRATEGFHDNVRRMKEWQRERFRPPTNDSPPRSKPDVPPTLELDPSVPAVPFGNRT